MKESTRKIITNYALIIGILAATLTVANFIDDKYLENKYLTIIPTSQGVSLITKRGTDFFEVGDEFSKLVGNVATSRGTGGELVAWKIFFDGELVACVDRQYGSWWFCANQGYKDQLIGCAGYVRGCDQVASAVPLKPVSFPVEDDVHVTGEFYSLEHIGGHSPYDMPVRHMIDFVMPVYKPKTVTRYVKVGCQSTEPSKVQSYCAGVCEGDICTQKIYVTCQTTDAEKEGFCEDECVNNICKVTRIEEKFVELKCQTENEDLEGWCAGECDGNLCMIRVAKQRSVTQYLLGGWQWFINIFR